MQQVSHLGTSYSIPAAVSFCVCNISKFLHSVMSSSLIPSACVNLVNVSIFFIHIYREVFFPAQKVSLAKYTQTHTHTHTHTHTPY